MLFSQWQDTDRLFW